MKIITLGLDSRVLDSTTALAQRFVEYGEMAERFDVIVPGNGDRRILSNRVTVYSFKGKNKIVRIFRLLSFFSKLQKENKYEIISTRDLHFLGTICVYFTRKYSLGLEIQVHGFEKCSWLRNKMARFVLKRASALRVVSKRLKEKLIKEFGISEEKITVVPIFVNCKSMQAKSLSDIHEPHGAFIFVTVGRLVKIKNIHMQLAAMHKIVKDFPHTRLLIAGDGPLKESLKLKVKSLKLGDKVTFLGGVADVTQVFKDADCFLLTSNEEGYGLAPIEAAAYGLPIIMTDVGCAGEVITHDENGIIIPTRDKIKLIESMKKMITNSEFRNMVRENNKLICAKLFSFQDTLGLYQKSWQRAILKK